MPDVNNVDKREQLNWERELIGLYISDHPLTPYQQTLTQIVTHFSGQLNEAQHEEKIRVAGLVTNVRPYMTKTNKAMGFVTIEDIQGNIELVLFPRTWEKYREQLSIGQIIIVEGKADTSSTPPKVLVDSIRTEIKVTEPLDDVKPRPSTPQAAPVSKAMPRPATQTVKRAAGASSCREAGCLCCEEAPPSSPPFSRKRGPRWGDFPPPPDNFPDGWDEEWQPSFEHAEIAARAEPKTYDKNIEDAILPNQLKAKQKLKKRNRSRFRAKRLHCSPSCR